MGSVSSLARLASARLGAFLVALVLLFVAHVARADCAELPACCITDPDHVTVALPHRVRVGLDILNVGDINERAGTFHADVYLMTRWPVGGIAPPLRIRNVVDTANIVEDHLETSDGFCSRATRIQDDFHMPFALHRFPFDQQRLRFILEDFEYIPGVYDYDEELWPMRISDETYHDLQDWRLLRMPTMSQHDGKMRMYAGDIPPRILTVDIPVERAWEFYVSRYFVPLLLIVALAYSLFFVRLDDLASSSGIGITAVLAIIAFQLAQADAMPHVAYLTLADKIYSICYLFTATALALTIHGTHISRGNGEARAERLQRRYRVLFPALFVVSFLGACAWGWAAGSNEASSKSGLPPAPPPPGEAVY